MTQSKQDKLTFEWKPLFDVILLVAASVFVYVLLTSLPWVAKLGFYASALPPALVIFSAWVFLRRRGISFRGLGVRMPENPGKTILIGLAIAIGLFVLSYVTEALGMTRDLSRFDSLKGNLPLALYGVLFGFFGAGFYEEVVFRGYLTNRFAHMLGQSSRAWIVAMILQGVIFGLAHYYQGLYAVFYTGILGTALATVYVYGGRNLWPLIIGHGVYDSARFVYFYYMLTYGGLDTLAS